MLTSVDPKICELDDEIPLPSEIKSRLDRVVRGHDAAKRHLSSVVFKHLHMSRYSSAAASNSHSLIIGKTGTGKSFLVTALREILDLPLVVIDATTLTEAGYHGRDVDSILEDLLHQAKFDRLKAERGIVFVDEFDKLVASPGTDRDIRGRGVQCSFLKMLDGDIRQIQGTRTSRFQTGQTGSVLQFDTRKLLFVFAGAFSDYPELNSSPAVTQCQISKIGFMPELVARITSIIPLDNINARDLESVLSKDGHGIIAEYSELCEAAGCALELTPNGARRIAQEAAELGLGFRGVRVVLDRALFPIFHELGDKNGLRCRAILDEQEEQLRVQIVLR